ncbi:MAG: glycosyltransferase [Candidatus Sericytochromatia bacterium]
MSSQRKAVLTLCLFQAEGMPVPEAMGNQLAAWAQHLELVWISRQPPPQALLAQGLQISHYVADAGNPPFEVFQQLGLKARGEYIWFVPADVDLNQDLMMDVLPLLSRGVNHYFISQNLFECAVLLELIARIYPNSPDRGPLEALFASHSLSEWLNFCKLLTLPFEPLGLLSGILMHVETMLIYLAEIPSESLYPQNQLFFTTIFQRVKLNHVTYSHLFTRPLYSQPMVNEGIMSEILSPGLVPVLRAYKQLAGDTVHETNPFDLEQILASPNPVGFLYPFLKLASLGRQIADFVQNAITSARQEPGEAFGRSSEIQSLYQMLPHANLSHRLLPEQIPELPAGTTVHKRATGPKPKVSMILLDWECREYFQALAWLKEQDVPREDYELIWVELFLRVSPEAMAGADVVVTCGQQGIYHKHRGYNVGLLLARGDIITVCDSDAVFPREFIRSLIEAFESDQRPEPMPLVLMHNEGRSPELYPEDFNQIEKLNAYEWTDLWPNAGACMSVRKRDAIFFGGFDEHPSYQGYICGPYDLAWRLINAGVPQRWHDSVFLWHFAHPHANQADNTEEWNEITIAHIEHHAATSVALFSHGRIQPLLENPIIKSRRLEERVIGSKYERRYAWYNPAKLPLVLPPDEEAGPQAMWRKPVPEQDASVEPGPDAKDLTLPEQPGQEPHQHAASSESVSVIMRVSEHPELLQETLSSLLAQKYPHLELIVVNLLDVSLDALDLGVRGLPPISLLQAQGQDPRAARDMALRMASGRYIVYLDCGDRWHGQHLATLLQGLQQSAVVYSGASRRLNHQTPSHLERLARDINNAPDFKHSILLGHFLASVSLGHHRDLLKRLPLMPEWLQTDEQHKAWRELQALLAGPLLAGQSGRQAQDWDLMVLLTESGQPQRIQKLTCEYLDTVDVRPADGLSLADRIRESTRLLESAAEAELLDLALVLPIRNQANEIDHLIADVVSAVPEHLEAELVLIDQNSQDRSGEILGELIGDIRCVRLGAGQSGEQVLWKGVGAAHSRQVLVIQRPAALDSLDALPTGEGLWQLEQGDWQPLSQASWQNVDALYASAWDWRQWLDQLVSQPVLAGPST